MFLAHSETMCVGGLTGTVPWVEHSLQSNLGTLVRSMVGPYSPSLISVTVNLDLLMGRTEDLDVSVVSTDKIRKCKIPSSNVS